MSSVSIYVSIFYAFSMEKHNRRDCKHEKEIPCRPSIRRKVCRQCLEDEEGIVDKYIDIFGDES